MALLLGLVGGGLPGGACRGRWLRVVRAATALFEAFPATSWVVAGRLRDRCAKPGCRASVTYALGHALRVAPKRALRGLTRSDGVERSSWNAPQWVGTDSDGRARAAEREQWHITRTRRPRRARARGAPKRADSCIRRAAAGPSSSRRSLKPPRGRAASRDVASGRAARCTTSRGASRGGRAASAARSHACCATSRAAGRAAGRGRRLRRGQRLRLDLRELCQNQCLQPLDV